MNATADVYNAAGSFDGTSPVTIDVSGAASIGFSVSGDISINSGANINNADGIGSAQGLYNSGSTAISGITVPHAGSLAGVFYLSTASLASALDFTGATGFTSLSPALNQVFFIGDGLTGDGTGTAQSFIVPTGATTLYLGLADACSYSGGPSCFSDNSGSFSVTPSVTPADATPPVPEPGSLPLLLAGLAALVAVGGVRRLG